MALNKQVHIYSIDTGSFYTNKEQSLHKNICFLKNEKNKVKEKIHKIEYILATYGCENYRKFNYNELHEEEYCLVSRYIKDLIFWIEIVKHKNELINKSKEKLLSLLSNREKANDKSDKSIRQLNPKEINEKNIISIFDSSLTRTINLKQDELTDNIMVVKVYYFDIAKDIIKHGFMYNNEKYRYFTSSAGQIRQKKMVFIKESIWNETEKTLMCGLTIDKINEYGGINVNKFLAYLALSNSATDLWEDFDIDRCIVVEDFENEVSGIFDSINDEDYSIKRINGTVPITQTDGCGMILPSLSKKNFMTRLPWVKGLLAVFPFNDFIKEKNGNSKIKDIYGKEYDIFDDNIQIIFTKSQFKMYKYYKDWQEYKDYFKEYNCTAGKCNIEEDKIPTARINYQMIQTLSDMTDNEIRAISKYSVNRLENLSASVNDMLFAFGINPNNTNKTNIQKALEIYPELLRDKYFKDTLTEIKNSMIKDYKSAKLDIRGKYLFVIPDLYCFCEWLFLGIKNPNGLLKDGEVFCRIYSKSDKLDCLRSPHLYLEHPVRKNVIDEEKSKWFITDAIYTSVMDLISKILQFDNDGDKLLVVSDGNIIKIAERNMCNIVPLYYNMKKAESVKLTNESMYNGLNLAFVGGNIGAISNDITKIWNSDIWNNNDEEKKKEALNVIKLLCMENNYTIDFAKTLYKPTRPKNIDILIKKYTKSKVPYFFQYAKDKLDEQIERKNNSVVNKLDDIITTPTMSYKKIKLNKIDYKLMCKKINRKINNNLIEKYNELNQKYHFKINMKNHDEGNLLYIYNQIKEELNKFGDDEYITDILVTYLYHIKNSKNKEVLWYCYGEQIVKNLDKNLRCINSYCKKCGIRLEKKNSNQKYCSNCDNSYRPIETKTIICQDCGKEVVVDSKDNETTRCKECYKKYRTEYYRLKKREQRNKIN